MRRLGCDVFDSKKVSDGYLECCKFRDKFLFTRTPVTVDIFVYSTVTVKRESLQNEPSVARGRIELPTFGL